ncbi:MULTISPECIES: non-ribosomal peptide synthetase [Streptomyces]|uniref:non-ribosomal peptide synthetase n=1 Tax=Streptomyces TaxID=1883 RepID=UPI00163CAA97|nr:MULTISPECIES: non-ribosomal peptide synthetase [Streptomyces]MBC2876586.1 amino acid adenylation domain-containing protein [Streptomyces sp. TYQ1024]UBI40745.1 amino acid adenylation domain-containing protein [Streptomyces mobaraensis]UKW33325.1 non-ribosomal peptide synthetase [Streptomyces sp. TYQ1024]
MTNIPLGLARSVLDRARRTPSAPAVVEGDHILDYAALDAGSAAVARALRAHGVRPGQAVAVALPRSARLVRVMLGVLRLGAVVVPLDAQSPAGRQRHILADSGATVVVHDGTPPAGAGEGVTPLEAAALEAGPAMDDEQPDEPAADPSGTAFVFYTSGTTGLPKGVEVPDAGILRLARPGWLRPGGPKRHAWLANPAFDALSFEVWVPLLTGGCCVVIDDATAQSPELLDAALRDARVDTLFVTTALFNAVADTVPDCFSGIGEVLIGGEKLTPRVIRDWYRANPGSATTLYNVYGPTECATFALIHPIPRDFDGDAVPIGRPLPGTGTLAVADDRPAAPGELAELLLSGEGLAAGYRNRPEETARAFVRLPWHDGGRERYYRTGDLVRLDDDGLVTYVGRADRQVKVRGFRIEPGELEQRITAHPSVRRAHVCARPDAAGVLELLAFVVPDEGLAYEEFDRHLSAALPPYMRPHHLYRVAALPRNANGKVDEAALLAGAEEPWRPERAVGADEVTAWQREVLDLAEDVLGVTGLRPGDRWIASGGDSLKALRLRFEARRRWGCEPPRAAVVEGDFASLAAALAALRDGAPAAYPPVPAPTNALTAPATSEQQRLWLLQQRDPDSRAYHVGMAFRLDGAVDTGALREALRRLVARHPALRTAFVPAAEGLRQEVGAPYDPWVTGTDTGDEAQRRFLTAPFDLARPEMFHTRWLPDGDGGGTLLLRLHHIAIDGWSLNVLFEEVSAAYAALVSGAEPEEPAAVPTPLDFAGWQAAWFATPGYAEQRAALRARLDGVEEAEPALPSLPRPAEPGRLLRTTLDGERRAVLDRLCADLGLTRFQLLLGVYAWSLYGVAGRTRPRLAGPVANRPVREFADSVGMFANTVPLPVEVAPRESLRGQLLRQGGLVREVLERQDVAFADVLADRPASPDGPPFDFLFVLENTDFSALSLPGVTARPLWPAPADAKCPMTLSVVERRDGLDCLWEYAADHFTADEVAAMDGLFRRGLDALAEGGDTTPAELVAGYRRALPEPGRGPAAEPAFATVAEGFARQVRRTPEATAVVTPEGREIRYAELAAYAEGLALEIRDRHPLPPAYRPASVALYLEPSAEHVVALLALARLGVTAVPLDPAYPPELLRQVLDQAAPLCVLVPPGGAPALDAIAPEGLPRHPVVLSAAPDGTDLPENPGTRPLYTLFTSGSTGRPKGVQVPDATLCNLLCWQETDGGLAGSAVTQQFSMLSFDVSFQEIFTTLTGGGRLHLVRPGWRRDAPALLEQLETAGVERLFLPYVALQLLAEHGVRLGRFPSRLREVVTAGEQLLCTDAIRSWFAGLPGARLFNHYGPTETHVVSGLCLDGDPAGWPSRPAIGRPVAGAVLRVVDAAGEPVPPGCPGSLLIGGPMAAPCYLGDDDLNAARFTEVPGEGLFYRSGDRAAFDRRGLLHYLGREDQQVKLSGHRLELGQVEAALLRHPAVVNAVVAQDGGRLVASLQCHGEPPAADDLTRHLAGLLPAHVRVDRFRVVEALPLTPSGKLDRRRALAAPGTDLRPGRASGPAPTPLEARISRLLEEVLGRPVGPDERFFDAGASSLDLMRFHLRCTGEPGLRFSIPDLFEHVSVRRLARFLEADGAPDSPAVAGDAAPGSPAVAEDRPAADEPIAVVGMAVRLPGADDLAAFWDLVREGRRGIETFEAADGLVGARSQLSGPLDFDPEHFGISRQEARLMDPQQRHLLMASVQALAHAGITGDTGARRTGIVAGCGENTYFQTLLRDADPAALPDAFRLAQHHDKDFLTTKVAYHLGLTGPAFTVQAACSSSLLAVHVAAGLLRQGDAEVMLAGGVLVDPTLTGGYRYQSQHIFSPDGHCRPFSDDAAGTVGASGVGVVVLKPLRLARRDGDTVYAVVTGSAVNNDGADKMSYSAPSLAGQREVIRTALRRSGRTAADLGYVEAHGTGTRLGDPIEVGALRQAYGLAEPGRCALSSVKSQLGHLGAAAGVVGLVRAALAVHHGIVPPTVGFRRLNPQIADERLPFRIPTAAEPWPADRPRVAAVSSFGIGGTNTHVVLEAVEPAARDAAGPAVPVLPLSSGSEAGLRADAARIADYLEARPEAYGRVLRHLQAGRPAHRWRAAAVCADAAEAVAWLRTVTGGTAVTADGTAVDAVGRTAGELAAAWRAGTDVRWPAGPAQAPWDFPPPAFDLARYEVERAAPAQETAPAPEPSWPERLPEAEWLRQPHWVRRHHAAADPASRVAGTLVVLTDGPLPDGTLRPFEAAYERVAHVRAAAAFARVGADRYEADPADPASLRLVFDALGASGAETVDWLHALPLAVEGPVGEESLDRARWACLDTPAALLRAAAELPAGTRLRPWWLSYGAQPVEGPVTRPELGLLAGAAEVVPQECGVDGRWLDLPGRAPADWAALPALLAEADAADETDTAVELPRRLALRQGYWWRQALLPVPAPAPVAAPARPVGPGTYLVLGGTGGIGRSVAAWLLEHADCRVVLLARRAELPEELAPWADRVDLLEADLATAALEAVLDRITTRVDGVVHAAGVAAGGLLVRRDAEAARRASAAKLRGALLVERLIERDRPAFAVYCSSMAAQFGGVGQFDYAAANGLLDGFARYQGDGSTLRIGVDWDVWSETGMALGALHADARHQAHLAVGLTVKEGQRLFADALRLRLPQLLVSTTDPEEARVFYAPPPGGDRPAAPEATVAPAAAERLAEWLCRSLGVDELNPEASLYDHGADSLTLLDLISTVEDEYGVELELSRLSHRVSLTEVLAHLAAATGASGAPSDEVPLDVWQEGAGGDVLCLVHPVGGDVQAYRELVSALDPRLTVCLISDPGLRGAEAPDWTVAERADRYLAALRRRFPRDAWRWRLAGWSFGAWVAQAMAAGAEAADGPVAELYLLDPPPPGAGKDVLGYDEGQLERLFARELAEAGSGAPAGPEARAYAERLARCCRANLAGMAAHEPPPLPGTPVRLWLADRAESGLPSRVPAQEQRRLWAGRLPLLAEARCLDTTHYGIVRAPHVTAVAEAVNAACVPAPEPPARI